MSSFPSVLFSVFAVLQICLLAMISSSLIDIKSQLRRIANERKDP